MARAVEELLDERISYGIVVVKRGHSVPLSRIQTGEAGKQVNRVYITDGVDIEKEFYLSMLVDRASGRIAVIAFAVFFALLTVLLGWRRGSLALIELVEALEEELAERSVGFHIDDEDLEDLKTVRDAVDYVFENAND